MNQETNKYIFGYFITIGFFGLIVVLIFFDIKEGSKEIVFTLLGVFGSAFSSIVNYFFGSSEGSKDKTKLLRAAE